MAQQGVIVPTSASATFPGCALSCTTLLQAQDLCLPPNQPQSSQLGYDQCFCTSPYLTPFASTPNGVCVNECTILNDREILQAWYNNFCGQVRQGIDPTTLTATTATTIPTVTVTATQGTTTATALSTGTSSPSLGGAHNQSWIDGHWKWILMLVILAIGLGLLAWLAVWLKRRHRRNVDEKRAQASGFRHDPEKRSGENPGGSATPDLWGPHQMMHATQGYGYPTVGIEEPPVQKDKRNYRGAESSRKLEKNIIGLAEVDKGLRGGRPTSQRARPSDLELNARMIGAADRRSKSRAKSRNDESSPIDKEIEVPMPEKDGGKAKLKVRDIDPEKT